MITALVLAAGTGERFGDAELPKQFSEIGGKPLFVLSVATYAAMAEVDRIIITANPRFVDPTRDALEQHALLDNVEVVIGGETRQASVQNSADALMKNGKPGREDLIIVHNAVSPNTRIDFIRQCIDAMTGYDAVQACVPDTRTVFERSGERVQRVLPRSKLVYNCDPLIYRSDVLLSVMRAQKERGTTGDTTSDTAIELGFAIRLLESSYDNIKVTNRWDLEAVKAAMTNGKLSD
jgi:2-C-methyl-D-erythritol 4-phosphate cytidylyltransferase